MRILSKFVSGEDATAENFNLPLLDADVNFSETDERFGSVDDGISELVEEISEISENLHVPAVGTAPIQVELGSQAISLNFDDSQFDLIEEGTLFHLIEIERTLKEFCQLFYITSEEVLAQAGQIKMRSGEYISWNSPGYSISFAANLASGSGKTASTLYSIWVGLGASSGEIEFWLTKESITAVPSELSAGEKLEEGLRLDSSSNLIPFYMCDGIMFFACEISNAPGEKTILWNNTINTNFSTIDASSFVPNSRFISRLAQIEMYHTTTAALQFKRLAADGYRYIGSFAAGYRHTFEIPLSPGRGIRLAQTVSGTSVISLVGYSCRYQ